jgi:hypothetical protein
VDDYFVIPRVEKNVHVEKKKISKKNDFKSKKKL